MPLHGAIYCGALRTAPAQAAQARDTLAMALHAMAIKAVVGLINQVSVAEV